MFVLRVTSSREWRNDDGNYVRDTGHGYSYVALPDATVFTTSAQALESVVQRTKRYAPLAGDNNYVLVEVERSGVRVIREL